MLLAKALVCSDKTSLSLSDRALTWPVPLNAWSFHLAAFEQLTDDAGDDVTAALLLLTYLLCNGSEIDLR